MVSTYGGGDGMDMQTAKLSGFRFRMADGILEAMQLESEEVSLK